jgi:hypothetical protein
MLVLARSLTLAEISAPFHADSPLIGWHNVVTSAAIAADTEDADHPATNMANPATHLMWVASPSSPAVDEYVTITTGYNDEIDYVGIARHNLGSENIPVSIEGYAGSWVEIVEETILSDDGPALFRFDPAVYSQVRVRLQPGDAPASIAVLYVGKLLVMERRLYVGHTPLDYARKTRVINALSESGNYLGSIVLGQVAASSAAFQLIDPAWYRTYLDPFIARGKGTSFFFAWRPYSYPREVGYAWLTNDPMPKPVTPSHLLEIELQMSGIV